MRTMCLILTSIKRTQIGICLSSKNDFQKSWTLKGLKFQVFVMIALLSVSELVLDSSHASAEAPPVPPNAAVNSNPGSGVYEVGGGAQALVSKSSSFSSSQNSSSSKSEEEPGIDPSLFPRYIDFRNPNSSSMDSDEIMNGEFDFQGERLSTPLSEEEEDQEKINELVFSAHSPSSQIKRSLSFAPQSKPSFVPMSGPSPRLSPSFSPSPSFVPKPSVSPQVNPSVRPTPDVLFKQ
ncbi:hypothetical protein EBS43_05370 [bacterium]|nr:hypothetical protein [bacterium]